MIELNRIYNEDCLEGMKRIPDGSIDAVICDLPYGTTACTWDVVIPFANLWEQYERVTKKGGVIVLTAQEPFTSELILSNVNHFKEKLTWVKHKAPNFGNAKYRHLKYTEDIVVFSFSNRYTYHPQMQKRVSQRVAQAIKNGNMNFHTIKDLSKEVSFATQYKARPFSVYDPNFKYPSNVLNIPAVVSTSKERCNHPTQKPVALIEYLISTYTNEGDTVLDNCMGSGTTAIACIREHRSFIGFETDKEYFEKSLKRIEDEQRQTSLF